VRDITLNFKVSQEEEKQIRETVEALGTTLSQHIRSVLCGQGVKIVRLGGKLYDVKDLKEIEIFKMQVEDNGEGQKETVKK